MARFVVGVSGASGIILSRKLIEALASAGHHVELILTQHALYTASLELGKEYGSAAKFVERFPHAVQEKITSYPIQDVGCAVASGSYLVEAMVVVPCSMATVAALSIGLGDNALRRAADVTLKEKRPLILVPREAPLSELHLENLLKLSRFGATILPPVPAWYTEPQSLADIENFIVGKILDTLRLPHHLYPRWPTKKTSA